MATVIDTNILVTIERRGLDLSVLQALLPQDEDVALAIPTISELILGVHRLGGERQARAEAFVEMLLEDLPVLPFGIREARLYGRIAADLLSVGMPLDVHDLQIAAIALANNHGVLTENVSHFGRILGLSITTPQWP